MLKFLTGIGWIIFWYIVVLVSIFIFSAFITLMCRIALDTFGKCQKCGSWLTYKSTHHTTITGDDPPHYLVWKEKYRCCTKCGRRQLLKRICGSEKYEKVPAKT